MSRIFWDTNLFIYLFEGYGELSEKVQSRRERMLQRGDQLLTSTLTLGKLSVKSTAKGAADCASATSERSLRQRFCCPSTPKWQFNTHDCDRSIRPPDAVQLACASSATVDLFITNHERLHSKHVDEI